MFQHKRIVRLKMLRSIFAGSCSMMLAACDLINPYEPPTIATPAAYIEQPGALVTQQLPATQWWKNYGSPELDTLVAQALANNNDLAAAIARVREADAQLSISGAPLLPNLSGEFTDTRSYTGNTSTGVNTAGGVTTFGGGSRYRTTYNARLRAAYELDFWGKNRSALVAAEATRDAQMYDQQVVALSIAGSVASVYFDLLATDERLAIATKNLANARQTLNALQRRFTAGLISRLEVTQQQSIVAEQEAALPPLQLKRSQNRDALAKLLGVLPGNVPLAKKTVFAQLTIPVVPAGLPSTLLARRPDVARDEAQLIAQHANINVARASFFPTLSLTGSGGYVNSALSNLIQPGSVLVNVAGALTQPIFDGGTLFGQLDSSHARYDELIANYRKSITAAFADTEDALAGVQRGAEQAQAQQGVLKAARDSYQLSKRQFDGGIVDITTALSTQRSLFSAEDTAITSRLQQLNATATLYQALGGGWEKPPAAP